MEASTADVPAKTVLRLAAISGSLRRASANTGLIRAAAEICKESIPGLQVDHVDISELPLLNTDLEVDGSFPPAVEAFRAKVRAADCFLFASPEYNYSISAIFPSEFRVPKNCMPWTLLPCRPSEERAGLGITAAELLCRQSRGDPERVGRVRRQPVAVPHLDIHFINKPEIFTKAHLPPQKFDDDGNLMDPETKEQLRKMLLSLQAFALRLQGKTASSEQGN
ncbi:putative NADPH:quinone oxidoreductase 2 [Panicum miliaceum]|uniref:NAD(P)H dehydrogenase (quinone) n=1 Tax=Panicum miliaceum TaxID=4540 RepID=A0A3L6SMS3_PANMI|nr:putative NADPH:quinone oxidoreductase 2 [Panicum miliaceum]